MFCHWKCMVTTSLKGRSSQFLCRLLLGLITCLFYHSSVKTISSFCRWSFGLCLIQELDARDICANLSVECLPADAHMWLVAPGVTKADRRRNPWPYCAFSIYPSAVTCRALARAKIQTQLDSVRHRSGLVTNSWCLGLLAFVSSIPFQCLQQQCGSLYVWAIKV